VPEPSCGGGSGNVIPFTFFAVTFMSEVFLTAKILDLYIITVVNAKYFTFLVMLQISRQQFQC
jgi:hypothetical protein